MFTTKNRSQRWRRFRPVMLLSLTMLSPPGLLWKYWEVELGGWLGECLFLEMPRRTFSLQFSR